MISAVIGECPRIDRRKPSSKSVSVNMFECPAKSGDKASSRTGEACLNGESDQDREEQRAADKGLNCASESSRDRRPF